MTSAAQAVAPPTVVGVHAPLPNAFAALRDASSVDGDLMTKDADGVILSLAAASLQTLIDDSFASIYGPDSTTDPTPRRLKGLFDDGAQIIDRLLSEIRGDHERRLEGVAHQVAALEDAVQYDRGALRSEITSLRTETEDALIPTVRDLSGLAALARKTAAEVNALKATQDALVPTVRDLSSLAAMAHQTALDVTALMTASEEHTYAIVALRQDITEGRALKAVVDDLKTRQLTKIREDVKRVEST